MHTNMDFVGGWEGGGGGFHCMEKIFSRKVAETKSVHLRATENAVIFIEKKDFN